jgi:hypothetical protein
MRGRLFRVIFLCMIAITTVGWVWLIFDGIKWLVS